VTNIKNSSTSRYEALILRGFYLNVVRKIHVYWECVGSVTFTGSV